MPSLSVAELALLLGAEVEGDGHTLITGANALSDATPLDLSFASGQPSLKQSLLSAAQSKAGCLLAPLTFERTGPWALIRVSDPKASFARALQSLYPAPPFPPSIHPTAIISPTANIAADVHIGAYVTIGEESIIESGCVILNGCVIGNQVQIGQRSTIHSNVSIYDRVRIGARVIIHSNCVIGADGFGFVLVDGHYRKFPQVGIVELQDDVELGAGCCIDRAALGVTRIGRGTKLDNLVHVAHNCTIGEDVVIAAQAGFSGSVTVGNHCLIGGQAGFGEKARIEARAVIGGKAGILTSAIVRAGEPVWGIPARPLRQHLKSLAHTNKLPELKERVHQLEQKIDNLEKQLREYEKVSN